jgi:hypothetical protein
MKKIIKLNLNWNKANNQINMCLPKKEFSKELREKLMKYKKARIKFEGFE